MHLSKAAYGRIALLLLGVGFLLLLGTGAGIALLVSENRAYTRGITDSFSARVALSDMLGRLQDAETGQRGYLLTGDERYLDPYRRTVAALPTELPQLAALLSRESGQRTELPRLRPLIEAKMAELRETIDLLAGGDRPGAESIVRSERGREIMNAFRARIGAIDDASEQRLAERSAALDRVNGRLAWGAGAALVLIALIGAGSLVLALRYSRVLEAAAAEVRAANEGLERRVAERTADLAAANAEIQRFAYIVSHDLRAPLVNVMGFAAEMEASMEPIRTHFDVVQAAGGQAMVPVPTAAAAREALDAEIPEAIGFIRSSTERMDRLINAILKLSREGGRTLTPARVDMTALVRGIAASLRHQLDAQGGELRVEGVLPDLVTDRLAAEQVFGNLLDNAVKYLDPARPGRIVVRGREVGSGMGFPGEFSGEFPEAPGGSPAGRHAVFEVVDNGCGIAAGDLQRIFEPFRRAGAQDRPGEGIGLAHVRALVRRLDGKVEVSSRHGPGPGSGSTFRVTLPLVLSPAAPARDPNRAS